MAESHEYEYDEYGGHKPVTNPVTGNRSVPILGCSDYNCPARFYTAPARKAHIEVMHPGQNSGPTEEMIRLGRMHPDIAKNLGISEDELRAPINVHEFNERQQLADTVEEQRNSSDKLQNHPIFGPIVQALSHGRNLEANALNKSSLADSPEIRRHYQSAHEHLLQFGYGHAIGKSLLDPVRHLQEADYHLAELSDHAGTDPDIARNHINRLHQIAYGVPFA